MSAALTHAAMGLLLGLALRLSWKQLPLAALLAELPDLDHLGLFLPVPGLEVRATLHNVFFCLLLPIGLAAWLRWRGVASRWHRLALSAPLLLTSHLLLDMLPLDPLGAAGAVQLFYPLLTTKYMVTFQPALVLDPTTFSTVTLLLLGLASMAIVTVWAVDRAEGKGPARPWLALCAAWLLLVPAAFASGALIQAPVYPDAMIAMDAPTLFLPQGQVVVAVHHMGGADVALRLEVRAGTALVAVQRMPDKLKAGSAFAFDLPTPVDVRSSLPLTARLVGGPSSHVYAEAPVSVVKGHVPGPINLVSAGAPPKPAAANGGLAVAPVGSLRAIAFQGGAELDNWTNPDALPPNGQWSLPSVGSLTGGSVSWDIVAADDDFAYASGTFAPLPP